VYKVPLLKKAVIPAKAGHLSDSPGRESILFNMFRIPGSSPRMTRYDFMDRLSIIVIMKIFAALLIQCLVTGALSGFLFPDRVYARERSFVREAIEGAVYIYAPSATPCAPVVSPVPPRKALRPIGSGFIVVLKPERKAASASGGIQGYPFLITAHHVIGSRDSIIVRMNRSDRPEFACFPVKLIPGGKSQNVFASHRAEVDLIAIRLPDLPNTDFAAFDYSMILDEDLMKKEGVSEGTDIFTVGYLFGYSGNSRNFSVVRYGKVALLSNEAWYQSDSPRNMHEQAYLAELQSEHGLSGTPVMLQSPQLRLDKDGIYRYQHVKPYVIGVLKGGLRSWVGGDQGIAAIEPACHLRELLKKIADQLTASGIPIDLVL